MSMSSAIETISMSTAMQIENDIMANSCAPPSQLQAILLTATVAAAAGDAVKASAPTASARMCSGKGEEEASDAETDTTADAETVEQDSSTASDTEVEDVDIDAWKDVRSRMATMFSPAEEAFTDGFQPPPGLEPVHVRVERWSAVAGSLIQGLQRATSAKVSIQGEKDEETPDGEENEKEIDECMMHCSEWKNVCSRLAHALSEVQVEEERLAKPCLEEEPGKELQDDAGLVERRRKLRKERAARRAAGGPAEDTTIVLYDASGPYIFCGEYDGKGQHRRFQSWQRQED